MADFCKQCSEEILGEDFRDLAGLGYGRDPLPPGEGWQALCEGCGPTIVDNDGKCIKPDCLEKHGAESE